MGQDEENNAKINANGAKMALMALEVQRQTSRSACEAADYSCKDGCAVF